MNIESSQKLEQNKISIVYAGTPVLSKKILEKLNENFEIKAVLTQPDKIRGRTKIPSLAPVAEFAVKNNIECIKIENFQQNITILDRILNFFQLARSAVEFS